MQDERIADKRIDHWGVGRILKSGKFGSCVAYAASKADAERLAAHYQAYYGGIYRVVAFNKSGDLVDLSATEVP